jgi:hypothetical protein
MLCERMVGLIIAAALGSIAISALLAWILWRMNAASQAREGNRDGVD